MTCNTLLYPSTNVSRKNVPDASPCTSQWSILKTQNFIIVTLSQPLLFTRVAKKKNRANWKKIVLNNIRIVVPLPACFMFFAFLSRDLASFIFIFRRKRANRGRSTFVGFVFNSAFYGASDRICLSSLFARALLFPAETRRETHVSLTDRQLSTYARMREGVTKQSKKRK